MGIIFDNIPFDVKVARCSKCLSFIDLSKAEICSGCNSIVCYHCGYCHCDMSIQRAVKIWASSEET